MHPVYDEPFLSVEYADSLYTELLGLKWLQVTEARQEYFMSLVPRSYAYKTFDGSREYRSSPWSTMTALLPTLLGAVCWSRGMVQQPDFNVCFLNRYEDQTNHLGWHADDSPEMDHDHPIAVVSLGAEREIWWKQKDFKGEIPKNQRQRLAHGSLFLMPPGFQREYLHRIPKADRTTGRRISLTFRRYIDKPAESR